MAHPDLDQLLNVLLPFAQEQLAKTGGFVPFGASLDVDGQVHLAMAAPDGDNSTPTECLEFMRDGVRQEAATSNIRATGMCWDAFLTVEGAKSDAIAVDLEHAQGESVNVFVPYRKRLLRGLKFGDTVATPREPEVFA